MNLQGVKKISFEEYKTIIDKMINVSLLANVNLDKPTNKEGRIFLKSHSTVSYVDKCGHMGGVCKFNFDSKENALKNHLQQRVLQFCGSWLQCYEGYISETYKKEGFKVVASLDFNPKFAHKEYKKTFLVNEPKVLFLVKTDKKIAKIHYFNNFELAKDYAKTLAQK